ncbi:MAG TPA: hypothetical protein VK166_04015, partial [Chitinophagaceae bacterium]|nr:hypothetical protein [Chitinophagaceae bacterium]
MQKIIILLLIACMSWAAAIAQQNKFTLGLGIQRTWMLDKQSSPLKYQTGEKSILLGYDHIGSKGIFSVHANGALGSFFPTGFHNRQMYDPGYNEDGTPKADSFAIPGTLYSGRFSLSYLRQGGSGNSIIGKGDLSNRSYLGGSLSNQLFYSDNIVRTGWFNSTSFNAEYLHTARFNTKHYFSIKISIPLIARNTRLQYHNTISSPTGEGHVKTFFKEGSGFAWLGNFQNIQLDAGYEYSLSDHFSMG